MRLGLIGKAILNSSSPDLHVRLGELTGVQVSYDLFDADEVPIDSLSAQVHALIGRGYRGVNVTYPFKEEAAQLATDVSMNVNMIGSSNTLIFENGAIRAENTDCSGFIGGFRATFGERDPGRVLQLGTGGVGKAVAFALGQLGAREVVLVDIDQAKARALADELNATGFHASSIAADALASTVTHCDGLVNCTPVGHEKSPGCPLPGALIRSHHWVFDAVYVPANTEFIRNARVAGADVMSGVSLFVFQGVDAFKFFCKDTAMRARADAQAATLFARYKHELLQEQE